MELILYTLIVLHIIIVRCMTLIKNLDFKFKFRLVVLHLVVMMYIYQRIQD